jgi:hypothetical protein
LLGHDFDGAVEQEFRTKINFKYLVIFLDLTFGFILLNLVICLIGFNLVTWFLCRIFSWFRAIVMRLECV